MKKSCIYLLGCTAMLYKIFCPHPVSEPFTRWCELTSCLRWACPDIKPRVYPFNYPEHPAYFGCLFTCTQYLTKLQTPRNTFFPSLLPYLHLSLSLLLFLPPSLHFFIQFLHKVWRRPDSVAQSDRMKVWFPASLPWITRCYLILPSSGHHGCHSPALILRNISKGRDRGHVGCGGWRMIYWKFSSWRRLWWHRSSFPVNGKVLGEEKWVVEGVAWVRKREEDGEKRRLMKWEGEGEMSLPGAERYDSSKLIRQRQMERRTSQVWWHWFWTWYHWFFLPLPSPIKTEILCHQNPCFSIFFCSFTIEWRGLVSGFSGCRPRRGSGCGGRREQ